MRLLFLFLSLLTLLSAETLQTNYFHPNQWRMYNPLAKELDMVSSFSATLINTSIYETESYYPDYILDAEILALLFQGSLKLSDTQRVDISMPIYYMSGGIMDSLVNNFHTLLGIHTPRDRNHEVYNQFRYLIKDGNTSIVDLSTPYTAIGNLQAEWVSLWFKKAQLLLGSSLGVKIPTSQDRAVSSGKVDYSASVIASYDHQAHHFNTNMTVTFNTLDHLRSMTESIPVRLFFYLGYNYRFSQGNRFILEFKQSSPPYSDPVIEYFSAISSATNIGFSWKLSKTKRIQLFALEDNAPYKNYSDISFGLNYRETF